MEKSILTKRDRNNEQIRNWRERERERKRDTARKRVIVQFTIY